MVGVREVLRAWLEGRGLRAAAERAGVDRKTARRHVQAAEQAGLSRDAGLDAVTDDVLGRVAGLARPGRPSGHGVWWDRLEARRGRLEAWVAGKDPDVPGAPPGRPLTAAKITELLAREGTPGRWGEAQRGRLASRLRAPADLQRRLHPTSTESRHATGNARPRSPDRRPRHIDT
jgi:hypothetical protein